MKRGYYPRFSFAGRSLKYERNYVAVYDPDTFFAVFPVEGVMYEHSFRVMGYDSIENKIKKTELQQLTEEQRKALVSRRDNALIYTKYLLEYFPCTVATKEQDKYGRILCQVTVHTDEGDLDLSETLIKSKLVFAYGGETKLSLAEYAYFCLENPMCIYFNPVNSINGFA